MLGSWPDVRYRVAAHLALACLSIVTAMIPGAGWTADDAVAGADGTRYALIIGNANYPGHRLPTPINDARAMARKLKSMGFVVDLVEDATAADMQAALGAHGKDGGKDSVALFFFAGFSQQSPNQLYLLPVDAKVAADRAFAERGVPIDLVTKTLQKAGGRSNVVIVDAVPHPAPARYRGLEIGSASIATPPNFLIAYSNGFEADKKDDPPSRALSAYTKELLAAIGSTDRTVDDVFKNVQLAISETTKRGHIPWHISSLSSDVYLVTASRRGTDVALTTNEPVAQSARRGIRISEQAAPATPQEAKPPTSDGKTAQASGQSTEFETALWDVVKKSENPADFEAYLEVFPTGQYAKQAQERIAALRGGKPPKPRDPAPKVISMQAEFAATANANVREGPNLAASVLGTVAKGDAVQVTGRVVDKNWFRIKRDDGSVGYMSSSVLKPLEKERPLKKEPEVALIPPSSSAPEPSQKPGTAFRDCPQCPQMVTIPAGTFRMGSNASDATEGPVRTVRIGNPFAIGQYEVTLREWSACVDAGGCSYRPRVKNVPGEAPAHKLSWKDIQEYLGWLRKVTGKRYRLPTEAEWEYAARGGTTSRYWWGDRMTVGMADCKECGGNWSYAAPGPVGRDKANPFGLHGVSGGVWEWTEDCWSHNYDHAPVDGSAVTSGNCSLRVLRGGSWRNEADYARTASRFKYDFNVRYSTNGFRVARDLQ